MLLLLYQQFGSVPGLDALMKKIITHILDIVFITRSNFFLSEIYLKFYMEFLVLMFLIGQRSVGRWSVGRLVDGRWQMVGLSVVLRKPPRCIEIKQKVILASNESDIKSNKQLARKPFYRILERRLLSSYVIQEIKPLIRNNASDGDLIPAVTKASATEKRKKLSSYKKHHKKALRVFEISGTCNRSGRAYLIPMVFSNLCCCHSSQKSCLLFVSTE